MMKRIETLKGEALRLIGEHDGELSWYQLDRALAYDDNLPLLGSLGELLDGLEAEGLIEVEGAGAQPRFRLTAAGRARNLARRSARGL
jgi:DNA-binding PadR family transcriptional regulator